MTIRGIGRTSRDLDRLTVERAYARWAPIYDAVFGPMFLRARRAATAAACEIGGRILEVGVGTGLSFENYPQNVEVFGIDISEPMIERARERMSTGAFPQVASVQVMDAHDLAFPDDYFDCVVAQFVITLVATPERVLSECARVVRPGGEIILVNHFYSEHGLAAAVERWCARHAGVLGLRPEFPFARIASWVHTDGRTQLIERRQLPLSHTLVRLRRTDLPALARSA